MTTSNYLSQFAASRAGPTRYVCAAGIYPDFRWPNDVTDYPIEIVPADRNNPPTFRAIQFGGTGGTSNRNFSHLSGAPAGSNFNNIKFDGVNFIAQRFTSAGSVSLVLPDGQGLGWRIQGTSHPSAGLVGAKESGSYDGLDFNAGTNITVTNCIFDGYAAQLSIGGSCNNVTVEYNTFRNLAEDGIKFSCNNFIGRWNLFDQSRGPTFEMSDYSGGPNPPHPDAIQQMGPADGVTWENNVVIDRMLYGANLSDASGEMHGALFKKTLTGTDQSTRVTIRDNEVRTLGGTGMGLDDFKQGTAIPGTTPPLDVIITGNWVWTGGPAHISQGVAIFGRFGSTSWTNARMEVTNNVAPNLWLGGAAGNTDNGDGESATPQPSGWVEKAPDRVAPGANRAGRYGWNAGVVPPPAAPSGLTATAVSSSQINLTWTDNASDETGFKIERKKGSGGTYAQIYTTGANATSYSDTTCGAGTNYYYRVRATNASGDSGYSNEANATTTEITSGRVGHWKLDAASGTTATDSSGNSNTGTTSGGPTWIAGKIANGLNFDGVNDLVNCTSGSTLDQLSSMTVTAWIKADTMGGGGFGRIVQKGAGGGGGWRFLLYGTNQLQLAVEYSTTALNRISAVNALSTGVWRHVVATWTGSATATNVKLYVDGVEVSYATTTDASGTRASDAAANLYIGNESGGTRGFDGVLDDVRVYNRVLTAAEITAIHRAGL